MKTSPAWRSTPAEGRLYWTNFKSGAGSISYANLNGTGGGNISTAGAPVEGPEGVAMNPVTRTIYWGNYSSFPGTIGFAKLDGTGAGALDTTGANVQSPSGIAIDPVAGRIYWANSTNPTGGISYANLNDSGAGGNLPTGTATVNDPAFPSLLAAPSGEAPPSISGASTIGAPLTCSQGTWAANAPSEFFFHAPQAYTYSWQLNGVEIPGAAGATYTPAGAGSYTCRVTASNHAGAATQTSPAAQVPALPAVPVIPAPTITNLRESAARWDAGSRLARITKHHRQPVGTTISFTLNYQATVTLRFTHQQPGRNVGGRCLGQTHRNRKRRPCKRTVTAGTLFFAGHAGTNKVIFQGRMSRSTRLKPGRYTLIVQASNTAGHSTPVQLTFTIVK